MDSPVLVTGGAGYVGSVAVLALRRAGRRVVVLDDLSTGHVGNVRDAVMVVGDVGDGPLVERVCREHGIRAVMHFAAKALVGESMRDPALYDRENRQKTEALMEACVTAGVRRVILSSSCAVYGVPDTMPIAEGAPQRPVSPYGESKRGAEAAVARSGLEWIALRYFNAAGAVPAQGLGERHDPETHLIPLAIRAALQDEPLPIFGTTYATPDGTCVRDYVHVLDLADAHVKALAHLEGGGASAALNLGTGRGVSVREVTAIVGELAGRSVPTRAAPARVGDPQVLVADPRAARRVLEWRPEHSDIRQIAADAIAFAKAHDGSASGPGVVVGSARMSSAPTVIAIDGPAGAGKSTIARRLAEELDWAYLDTGAMYRGVTLMALRRGIALDDGEGLAGLAAGLELHLSAGGAVTVGDEDVTPLIRTPEVTAGVSHVASVQAVRDVMVRHQHRFAHQNGRIVAEGRDMGTVVFPEAELKIYLEADPVERARRRLEENSPIAREGDSAPSPGRQRELDEMQALIERRDELDSTREVAPLRPAEDAWRLDTTSMTLDEVYGAVRSRVRSAIRS